jgi:UDP-N-acetyl-D-glucosamine dehydrogenase
MTSTPSTAGKIESRAPDGSSFPVPAPAEIASDFAGIRRQAEAHRSAGGKVVVVQGLGFVGAAVAAVIAGARDGAGQPLHFVIGTDLASPGSYWKVAKINAGLAPIQSPDPELDALIALGVREAGNLRATASEEAYGLADAIVIDLPLDVTGWGEEPGAQTRIDIRLPMFEEALRTIGSRMRADALVIVETTVPIGVCEKVALPILTRCREERGIAEPVLLAHAYERVMPGPRYVDSIRKFWRSYSGIDARSAEAAGAFLESFIDTTGWPLWRLRDTNSSEMAKLLENSYRAVNIAFIQEWTLLAERIGVNLFEVVESVRVRKGTHDNIRYPGFGVGGYCLTKDSLLAQWSATNLFDSPIELSVTLEALRINRKMPLHTMELAAAAAGGSLEGKRILVAGISYLPEVADTRNTPTEILVDALAGAGAHPVAHDPYVRFWPERPAVEIADDFGKALAGCDGLILAVPHRIFCELDAERILAAGPRLRFVVDAQNVIADETAARLHGGGVRVAGVGKGHWRTLGY